MIATLYRHHWDVELSFKWIKQHYRIKTLFDASESNVKKRLELFKNVHEILKIWSLNTLETTLKNQLLKNRNSLMTRIYSINS
jgi:IS4 transposase